MKRTCWNCRYFTYLDKGMCTKNFFEDADSDSHCNDFAIAEELKNGGKFVLDKNGRREWKQ